MGKKIIYFDNAATSYPKAGGSDSGHAAFKREVGANPGRSGHRLAVEAGRIVFEAREKISQLFGVKDSSRVVFGLNATEGINQGLKGLLRPGDHVITSSMEHNSVMRPLRAMMKEGLEVTFFRAPGRGFWTRRSQEGLPQESRMVVLNHASNVVGTLLPLSEIGGVCRHQEILFFVDAAQSAGAVPIDMDREKIDLLAFTGHKALFGPQGTGGLVLGKGWRRKTLPREKRGDGEPVRTRRTSGFPARPVRERNPECASGWPDSWPAWNLSLESASRRSGTMKEN